MKEIKASDIMHIGFLKKECFTGSNDGMRYRMERHEKTDDGSLELLVTVWPEPYAYEHTPDSEKESRAFSFDEAGVEAGRVWLNELSAQIDWESRRLS